MKKEEKRIILILLGIFIFILMVFLFFTEKENPICGDNTFNGTCSNIKPYFCLEGTLVERASICGCPENLTLTREKCISDYQINPKIVKLDYILRGEEGEIDFPVYEGMIDYISNLPNSFYYSNGESFSRQTFKLKKINEENQRQLILPLVAEIQNIAKDEKDQIRIAISLVQRIPYKESERSIIIGFDKVNYSRHAYEVLYEYAGACEGRSELLSILLKELGYEVVLLYYPLVNHEAVGIKCPLKYSTYGTGYCFIETTGPSILSNDQEYYTEVGRLSSEPEVLFISEGKSLDENFYEYNDARTFIKLNKIVEDTGELNIFRHYMLKALKEKYGLDRQVNI